MLDAQQFLYKNLFSFWPDEFASFTQITIDKYVEIVTNKYFTDEDIFNACQMLTRGRDDRNNDFMPKPATLSLRMQDVRLERWKREEAEKKMARPVTPIAQLTGPQEHTPYEISEEKKNSNKFIRDLVDRTIAEGKAKMAATDHLYPGDKERKDRQEYLGNQFTKAWDGDKASMDAIRAENRSTKLSESFKADAKKWLADMDAMRKAKERG